MPLLVETTADGAEVFDLNSPKLGEVSKGHKQEPFSTSWGLGVLPTNHVKSYI